MPVFAASALRPLTEYAASSSASVVRMPSDLSLAAQAKVLRALQEGEVEPIGAEKPTKVDVRVVAATHKDLQKEMVAGRFREDLYYRLCKVELKVPALRDREGDVELLARSLLPGLAERENKRFSGITPRALDVLRRYGWPGSCRPD